MTQVIVKDRTVTDENCPNCGRVLSQHNNKELVTCAMNELATPSISNDLRGIKNG